MKKLLIILTVALLSVSLLASCQKENFVDTPEEVTLTYQLCKDITFDVKSGNTSAVNVLWCGVYHKKQLSNGDSAYIYMSDMSDFIEITAGTELSNINVPITLIKNQKYKLIFVAQHRFKQEGANDYTYTYNIDYEGPDGLLDQAIMTLNAPDGECLEIFTATDAIGSVTGNENRSKTLTRPVSQINIGTSAVGGSSTSATASENFNITLSGVPASYNLLTGEYSEQTTTHTFQNLSPIDPAGTATLTVSGTAYRHLATLYILGGNKIDGTIQSTDAASTDTPTTFAGITTAPNYKTNIVGNINISCIETIHNGLSKNSSGYYYITNEDGLAYVLNHLFEVGHELENGGSFYLTASQYNMSGYTVASPVVPAGKTLNFYGQVPAGATITGISCSLIGGYDTEAFSIGVASDAKVSMSNITMPSAVLIMRNSGTVVTSGCTGVIKNNPDGTQVDADKINELESFKIALASGVKVITLVGNIETTETLTINRPLTINCNGKSLKATFNYVNVSSKDVVINGNSANNN